MTEVINLPQHLRSANLRAASYDEAANTVDIVWTTGADVLRSDYFDGTYVERLTVDPASVRLDRLNAGAPLLDTHNAYQLAAIIGSVVPGTARIEGGKGLATVKLSRAEGCADIVQNIRDGIITNISVGYNVHAFTRTEAADSSPAVMTATDWEPVELSAVPVPADPGAQIRLAQRSAAGLEVTPCIITRANPGSQSEATTMAKDTKPVAAGKDTVAGDAGLAVDTSVPTATSPDATPPKVPNNPNDNPDMVVEEVNNVPKKTRDPAETPVQDPGDAHGLPMDQRSIEKMMARAAADAVNADRERANEITQLGEKFGYREFAATHARSGTKVRSFRDMLMDKLAEERAPDGGPIHAARSEPSLEEKTRSESVGQDHWRRVLGKPAPRNAH